MSARASRNSARPESPVCASRTFWAISAAAAMSPATSFFSPSSSIAACRRRLHHVLIALGCKDDVLDAMFFDIHIHTVDHLSNGFLQRGGIVLKLPELAIKVIRQNEPLYHVGANCLPAHRLHFVFVIILCRI